MRISDWSSDVCSSDLGLLGSGVRLRSCGLLGRGVLRDGRGLRLGSRGRFGLRRGVLLRRGLLGFADRGDAQQRQRLAVTVATAIVVPAALLEDDDLFEIGRASCWERGWQYV